ncbi:MAG: sulfurtransferase [Gammaproteobacteria bacterium]|nr:sulfurtransferase [Gammaproteobacteria bacterium]MCI0590099.1 sulfurtransferase [Gammaproteobacteria bacterium]
MNTTLIDTERLSQQLDDPDWVIVDCRFDLADPEAGERGYLEQHIPKAVYAHLDRDLCRARRTGGGRHPMPSPQDLCDLFSRLGIDRSKQVVVYDSTSGGFAARLWWMLRYMGHNAVAVLDGGWQAWLNAGLGTQGGRRVNIPAEFRGEAKRAWLVDIDEVPRVPLLIDSRDPARYKGEFEPFDRVAGHIPGAINRFWKDNLAADGRCLSPDRLRRSLKKLIGGTPSRDAVFYCGSGVTACHNLLAVVHAGLPDARLYAGSWSEWAADPARPVATGTD